MINRKTVALAAGALLVASLAACEGVEDSSTDQAAPSVTTEAPPEATKAAPKPTTKAAAPKAAPKPAKPKLTVSQEQAVGSARDYLEYSSFSRKSLIKQLKYEGFSDADATFAVDYVNPDWMEQAARSAKDYLEYSNFSRAGLIKQLEYEGFTTKQAEYGAKSVGL